MSCDITRCNVYCDEGSEIASIAEYHWRRYIYINVLLYPEPLSISRFADIMVFVSHYALETYSSLINHTFEKWLFLVMNIYNWVLVHFLFIQYFLAKLLLQTRNFFRIRVMLKDACFQKKCKENLILIIDL